MRASTRSTATAWFLLSSLAQAAPAQSIASPAYDSAYYAWQAGRYPEALERLERILTGPERERLLEPVALLTGELYRTVEVSPDGRVPRWSPDGSLLAFESPPDRPPRTGLVAMGKDIVNPVTTLEGYGAAFSPDSVTLAYLDGGGGRVVLRQISTGQERGIPTPGLRGKMLLYAPDGRTLYLVGAQGSASDALDLYEVGPDGPRRLTSDGVVAGRPLAGAGGYLVYAITDSSFAIRAPDGRTSTTWGIGPVLAADGGAVIFVGREGGQPTIALLPLGGATRTLVRSPMPLANPAVSGDGRLVVYQAMPREDWELYVVGTEGGEPRRLTHEIQHDIFPRFVSPAQVLGIMGEGRHRRSYLYDVATGQRTRLFHNNTVRTVAPEYEWAVRPDGSAVAIVSERDGDTVSPERGVYLTDLSQRVTPDAVLERVRTALRVERDLRERGARMFAPVAAAVRGVVRQVSSERVYGYERDLFRFDSKHITKPGNQKAIDYLAATLRSFGYEPDVQWFEPRPGIRTANVVATLRGTANPGLQYVVGSHFDSVEPGPGADDNTSGTSALLEAARVLASHPQPATIRFVWFTGEEAGLLGSREFVRHARAAGDRVVAALNNDMVGWSNDDRIDDTIRYSNDGLRDLQHAAAFLFTDLITYDSRYYKFTDAHSLFDGFGDVIAGIGSYPILGNPHYHQSHDVLETVNPRLIAEVSKTTVASIMLMTSSPARLNGLQATRRADGVVDLKWDAAPERGVGSYRVRWSGDGPTERRTLVVRGSSARAAGVPPGAELWVRAIGLGGLEGWDWARVRVP